MARRNYGGRLGKASKYEDSESSDSDNENGEYDDKITPFTKRRIREDKVIPKV
jgi:hypothetical protein